ncbi:acyltransferase family protein [Leifsonia aquatica]|uniref:acyltransferase family protein n=1 Tax=Leifsonia aquatica TaxID=144185 RepID=UPI00384C7B6C
MPVTGPPLTRRELREHERTAGRTAAPTGSRRSSREAAQPSDQTGATATRFDAVDGMRGVAIISVLLYHCGWSTRGLFGVDAFFVVSGFLITLLMIREATSTGRIRIGRFYARRARRLLPSLFLTLAAVLLLVWAEGTLDELTSAAGTAVASLLQVANWQQIGANAAYWDRTGQMVPLGQMWSLSVTEQFYLVWPVVVLLGWFVCRRRPGGLAIWLSVALVGTALIAPLQYDGTNSDRLYLGTDSRIVAFVAGGAAAAIVFLILRRRSRRPQLAPGPFARVGVTALSAVTLTAVVAVSIATVGYHEDWLYRGGFALVAVAIAVFTATLCFPENALVRPFSWKPFRVVGMLSYSMFLLHLPVFWLVQKNLGPDLHPLALFGIGGIATWLAAACLHYLVAEPLRTRSWKPVGATIAILLGAGLVAGLAWGLPVQRVNAPRAATAPGLQNADGAFAVSDPLPFPSASNGAPLTVAVVGDSVAGNMYASLAEHRTADLTPVNVTYVGCGIFDATRARADDGYITESERLCWPWKDKLRSAQNGSAPEAIILHNLWDADDQLFEGSWVGPCTDVWATRYRSQLELLVAIGAEQERPPLILLSNDRPRDGTVSLTSKRLGCKTAIEDAVIAAHPNVVRLDLHAAVCPGGTCRTTTPDGAQLYSDGAHFTPEGLALMAPWLQNEIARTLPSATP